MKVIELSDDQFQQLMDTLYGDWCEYGYSEDKDLMDFIEKQQEEKVNENIT